MTDREKENREFAEFLQHFNEKHGSNFVQLELEEIKVELALALRAVAPGLRECIEEAEKKAKRRKKKEATRE